MTVPQIILWKDTSGNLHAEFPGPAGARQRIDLPQGAVNAKQQIETLIAALDQRERDFAVAAERLARAKKIDRTDPQVERATRLAKEKAEKDAKYNAWLDSLSPSERWAHDKLRDERLEKAKKAELDRARQVYLSVAIDHTVDLANRVVPINRRPRRKIIVNGKEISARETKSSLPPALKL